MKQRVIVQAIIKRQDTILLLRRSQGKPTTIGLYELPGGRLETDEQPDEAMKRHIKNDTGLLVQTLQLVDGLSVRGVDDTSAQNILLVYQVGVFEDNKPVIVGTSYDSFIWNSMTNLQHTSLRDSTKVVLDDTTYSKSLDTNSKTIISDDVTKATTMNDVVIYSDGGSRGNPGPSSAGYVIMDRDGTVIEKGGEYLGITTNNQAEYQAVRIGLEHALALGITSVEYRLDSLLVVNQMKGVYKIKNRELWPIHERIKGLVQKFDTVTFVHVPREQNHMADGMVNSILDKHQALEV